MSANTSPIHVGKVHNEFTQLLPIHGTRPRPIYTPHSSDGSRIHQLLVTTSDVGANTYELSIAKLIQTPGTTAAFVDGGGGSDTITDSNNGFITAGFKVGMRILILGATTIDNDFVVTLTGVAAGTLTFATATVNTAEAFLAGTKIYQLHVQHTKSVALNSGLTNAAPAVSALDSTQDPSLDFSPNRYKILGPGDILCARVGTLLGAGEVMDFSVSGMDYSLT